MLLVYEIRKSNAVIEGQSNVFFLYLVGQFREKNKTVELILTKKKKMEVEIYPHRFEISEKFITCINLFFLSPI